MIQPETWQEVLKNIEEGMSNIDAINIAGVGKTTFYNKINNDKDFEDSIKKALSKFKSKHVNIIAKDNSWQSSAWLLERKFKKEFGKEETIINEEPRGRVIVE